MRIVAVDSSVGKSEGLDYAGARARTRRYRMADEERVRNLIGSRWMIEWERNFCCKFCCNNRWNGKKKKNKVKMGDRPLAETPVTMFLYLFLVFLTFACENRAFVVFVSSPETLPLRSHVFLHQVFLSSQEFRSFFCSGFKRDIVLLLEEQFQRTTGHMGLTHRREKMEGSNTDKHLFLSTFSSSIISPFLFLVLVRLLFFSSCTLSERPWTLHRETGFFSRWANESTWRFFDGVFRESRFILRNSTI